jgi:soluble lytic murein transglycosylase
MEDAFWARNWQAMDAIYANAAPKDVPIETPSPLSTREKSIYVNGLWLQGRYEEGAAILESIQQDFPNGLRAYADMLLILGAERTDRKELAFERGRAMWEMSPPDAVKYYLAYAMARVTRDLNMDDESVVWYRRMYENAPDKKRGAQALKSLLDLGGANAEEAAAILLNSPDNVQALSIISADSSRVIGLVEYALGYKAYASQQYGSAMAHFELASRDIEYGEAARYYEAFSAYRQKKDDRAYSLWSDIAMTGFDYPQRSVQRLQNLAERSRKGDIIKLLKKIAAAREKDYPEVAADALTALIKIGDPKTAREAEGLLLSARPTTVQAATIRWDRGWKAWKNGKWRDAYDQWSAGYSPRLKNAELASRFLYWQSRALERLESPVASEKVKRELIERWPGEYHTFLTSPDGGIKETPVPENFVTSSDLAEWGFVTYARLEGSGVSYETVTSADAPALYRASRLALWEDDYTAAVRTFAVLRGALGPEELASSELLKLSYPRAYERDVMAAAKKTGVAPEIIWAVMRQESLFEADVTSSAGAYGLMQLMPATARQEAKKMAMSDDSYMRPTDNIMLGANHLVGLFARFKEAPLSLAAYNAGGTPVSRWSKAPITDMAEWVEDIGYRETKNYVKAVLRNIGVYRTLYKEAGADDGN